MQLFSAPMRGSPVLRLLIGAAVGLCLSLVVFLSITLSHRISELRQARQDSAQFSLSQLEVDYLKLDRATRRALRLGASPATLNDMRERFDVFFSRIFVIEESADVAILHEAPGLHSLQEQLKAFVQRHASLIDAPDAELAARLPEFSRALDQISLIPRQLSIETLAVTAALSDAHRAEIIRLLRNIAIAVLLMFLALLFAMAVLLWQKATMNRQKRGLAQSNARLASTLGASLDAIVVIDENGRVIDFNGSAETIFRRRRGDVLDHDAAGLLFSGAGSELFRQQMMNAARNPSETPKREELVAVDSAGREFPVEVTVAAVDGQERDIYISYIHDVTEAVEKTAELRIARNDALNAYKSKSTFLAVMSHEMRTPLNGIVSALDQLRELPLDPEQANFVRIASRSAETLIGHVNDVLDIERIEAGSPLEEISAFDPVLIAEAVVDTLGPLADSHQTVLTLRDQPEGTLVMGDERGFRQILTNLVGNAVKFTRDGVVRVELDLRAVPNVPTKIALHVAVSDTGPGISKEDLERIFDDFVTLNASYERRTTGTGLGLGIARRLVEAMGGSLECDSELGQGSTFHFTVTLPLAAAGTATEPADRQARPVARPDAPSDTRSTASEAAVPGPGAEPLHVLVVDDNDINRELLDTQLRTLGHHTTSASDGFEGVRQAVQRRFDLILMDISMPKLNGIQATEMIRSSDGLSCDVPIVAVTAHALPEERRKFTEAGMTDCLTKPVRKADLVSALGLARRLASAPPQEAQPTPAQEPPLVDTVQYEDLLAIFGEDGLRERLGRLYASAEEALAAVAAAAAQDDVETLRSEAHKFAGSAGAFGAQRLSALLARIEEACKAGQPDEAAAAARALPELWEATRGAYRERLPASENA